MREWRTFWRSKPKLESGDLDASLRQVGKTTFGKPIDPGQVRLIVDRIETALQLRRDDRVADLGCGNGLLTVRVAERIERIRGLDVSPSLIESAREFHAASNCDYAVADIVEGGWIGDLPAGTRKLYSYEVLQHLGTGEFARLLDALKRNMPPGFQLFAASVPDHARLRNFYDTPERYALYERNLASGQEQIGHWWTQEELRAECSRLGLRCTFMEQDPRLYTSHYRFDALIGSAD